MYRARSFMINISILAAKKTICDAMCKDYKNTYPRKGDIISLFSI